MDHAATQQTAYRLPLALLERLDRHADRLRRDHPGLNITRADVVRMLLTRALDDIEAARGETRSGIRKRR